MSAAIEAGIEGIPAVGFSLLDYNWNADFSQIDSYIKTIVENVLNNGLRKGVVLTYLFNPPFFGHGKLNTFLTTATFAGFYCSPDE